ncbi:MAG: GNAT family N-acetyltransferase [Deltaproteobacteria bacterium]|nr:GNAT family N-acetyltransferase [Deltaproteobacteria bacterium]
MASPSLRLRPATEADRELIFAWANDPVTRAVSFCCDPIPYATHCSWYADALRRSDRRLLVAELVEGEAGAGGAAGARPAAVVRFDLEPAGCPEPDSSPAAEISINIAPELRGRGLGAAILRQATCWAGEVLGAMVVVARIRPGNQASVDAFSLAGYQPAGTCRVQGVDALRYEWRRVG